MPEAVDNLMLDFLKWVAAGTRSNARDDARGCDRRNHPRTYGEAMDAWRTSCPRLSIWEDAIAAGLIHIQPDGPMARAQVTLTPRGQAMLDRQSG
jgi:hypothetical protein